MFFIPSFHYFTGLAPASQDDSVSQQSAHQMDVINTNATTPISLLIQSLVKQLCTLLEKDMTRANQLYNIICEKLHSMNLIDDSYAMGEFEVMRSQYQRALYQLVSVSTGSEIPIPMPISWPITRSGLEWSRYHKEFEELFFIAGGGFGSVFKARHRLDGVEYAIKKVNIKSSNVNSIMTHLAEVKTIASLNHPNIVNYKAAWLEPMIESKIKKKRKFNMDTDDDDFSLSTNQVSSVYRNVMKSFKTYNSKELHKKQNLSDFDISFQNSSGLENDNSSDENDSENEDDESSSDHNAVCKLLSGKEYEDCSRVNLKWATLYIQMTFCQQTLKQWLDDRNSHIILSRKTSDDLILHHSDSTDSNGLESALTDSNCPSVFSLRVLVDMFTQLVQGLHYIHSKGVIHHDVKPSNVFVGPNGNELLVQLGDFGLACPLQQSHSGLALGTHLYAAPEQLDGQCNPKVNYLIAIL